MNKDVVWTRLSGKEWHLALLVAAFDAADPDTRVEWVVGDMAPRTLATTRIAEALA